MAGMRWRKDVKAPGCTMSISCWHCVNRCTRLPVLARFWWPMNTTLSWSLDDSRTEEIRFMWRGESLVVLVWDCSGLEEKASWLLVYSQAVCMNGTRSLRVYCVCVWGGGVSE